MFNFVMGDIDFPLMEGEDCWISHVISNSKTNSDMW
jgi:hypothetical protein